MRAILASGSAGDWSGNRRAYPDTMKPSPHLGPTYASRVSNPGPPDAARTSRDASQYQTAPGATNSATT
jgi:hypothetical protein